MHVAIDVREACRSVRTGKAQWTYGFVTELLRREVSVTLLTDSDLPDVWRNHASVQVMQWDHSGLRWHFSAAKFLRSRPDIDIYVSPTSYIAPWLLGKKKKVIPIVHDLIAYRGEPHDQKAQWIERLTLPVVVKSAAHLCAISESTKADLITKFPHIEAKKVTTIYAGPMNVEVPLSEPDGKTILCIATLCPRKNQLRLIQAYAKLPEHLRNQYELVLVGARGWHDEDIVKLAKETPGVTWRNYVSNEEYKYLLSHCTVFALPSLYEGFGMQILDALQRGIPILTSRGGSLAEVAGESALYVDPLRVQDIALGLEKLLRDGELRERLRTMGPEQAKKFHWKRTVDLFLSALD
jgi:glycosyltransferase involved in cell wall biosynthesis